MSKYKVGDKFIVEIEEIREHQAPFTNTYMVKGGFGFDESVFDRMHKVDFKKSSYDKGLQDAWELALKVTAAENKGGINDVDCQNIFGTLVGAEILRENTYSEALAKIEAYEKAQAEIKVGDVVEIDGERFIVTKVTKGEPCTTIDGIREDGDIICYSDRKFKKTGKHIDIQAVLQEIGGES